jgi:hypothetical protein
MARSKDIEKLTEVAVEGGSPELAAVLLDEMSKGLGVDDKTVKAIFVDAMEKMGEAGHKRFLTAVDASYQKLTGKTLDEYIARQYSGNVGKGMLVGTMGGAALGALGGAVTGAIAGLHCALPGVIIGGIAGFIAGWTTSETGRFGANEKGCEYLDILDKARQTTHHISNPATVLRMMRKPVGLIGF